MKKVSLRALLARWSKCKQANFFIKEPESFDDEQGILTAWCERCGHPAKIPYIFLTKKVLGKHAKSIVKKLSA